jgi:hypothetical protein
MWAGYDRQQNLDSSMRRKDTMSTGASHRISENTLNRAAETALQVQDGCDLSGILQSFMEVVMNSILPAAREQGRGRPWVNQHPICTLFLDKLTSLNRTQCLCNDNMNSFSKAYDSVIKLVEGDRPVDGDSNG